jgi:hypothetical protein
MKERKLGFDRATLGDKVIEETDQILVMPAVIARELVQDYPTGKAYKPADELEKAAYTAEGRWVATMEHPETGLLTRRSDIKGRMGIPVFRKDITDPKTKRPKVRGISTEITWFKDKVPKQLIDDVKSGALKDVSIGFTYEEDATPGEFEGEHYDFAQRNIFIDHVVAPCPQGRCPSPYCGIGVDSLTDNAIFRFGQPWPMIHIAGDPWEETENYIRSGHKEPGNPCRTKTLSEEQGIKAIICKYGDKWEIQSYLFDKAKDWTMEKAKAWFKDHKGDAVDMSKEDAMSVTEIQAKIDELRDKRDALRSKLDEKYKAQKPTAPEPEFQKIYEEIEDVEAEIKAYRELKVQQIVAGSDCPICKKIDELGVIEASKRLGAKYGNDVLEALSDALSEKEKAKKEQESRAKKYGIAIKEGGNVTKPGEYANIPDDEFGDPVNYRYPIDKEHVVVAWQYWGHPDNQSQYNSAEKGKITDRIKAAMKKNGHQVEGEPPVKKDEVTPPGQAGAPAGTPETPTPPPPPTTGEVLAKFEEVMEMLKRLDRKPTAL